MSLFYKNIAALSALSLALLCSIYPMEEKRYNPESLKKLCANYFAQNEFRMVMKAVNEKVIPEELVTELAPVFAQKISSSEIISLLNAVPFDRCAVGLSVYCSNILSSAEKKSILYILLQPLYEKKTVESHEKDDKNRAILESIAYCVHERDECSFLKTTKNNLLLKGLLFTRIVNSSEHHNPFYVFLIAQGADPDKVMKKILIFKDRFGLQALRNFQKNSEKWFDSGKITANDFGIQAIDLQNAREVVSELHSEKQLIDVLVTAFNLGLKQSFFKGRKLICENWFCDKRLQNKRSKENILNFLKERKFCGQFPSTVAGRNMLYATWMIARWGNDEFRNKYCCYLKQCRDFYNKDSNRSTTENFIETINDDHYKRMYPALSSFYISNQYLYAFFIDAVELHYNENKEKVGTVLLQKIQSEIETKLKSREKAASKFWDEGWLSIFESFSETFDSEIKNIAEDGKQ